MKDKKTIEKIIAGINKNVKDIKWKCLISGCCENSINSHILQKNGVLNQIAPNGFVYEIKPKDVFKWESLEFKELTYLKKISINQAHSYPTFCIHHDTEIFKSIECHPIDFTDYKNNLLFAFRTLVSFMRREGIALEKEKRLYNSNILQASPANQIPLSISKEHIELHEYLIKIRNEEYDLMINDIESGEENFTYLEFNFPLKEVYSSSIISSPSLTSIYVNIFPYNCQTKILILVNKNSIDQWSTDFINSWMDLNEKDFEVKLTTHLLIKCENWGISENVFNNINQEISKKIIETTQSFKIKKNNMLDNNFLLDFNIF